MSTLKAEDTEFVCLLVGCLTSQQQASVSQGWIYSDNCTCCHTETEVADQTFYLTQSQYTDTGPTSPSADPITPGAWQGSHWIANFEVTGMTRPGKIPSQARFELWTLRFRGGRLNHSANEAVEDTRTEYRFPQSNHTSDLSINTLMSTLPYTWHCRVSVRTGWSSISTL